jgi:titin
VNFSQVAQLPANTTAYASTGLAPEITFTFRVRAYDGPNNSQYSNTASATTTLGPSAPTNLTATAVSSSRIDLAWIDNATNESGFKVERSTDGVNFTQVAILSSNITTYASTGLAPDTTYTFRVRAYDGTNNSGYSNTASSTTMPAPGAPADLSASVMSSSRVLLAWTDNATNETGFWIERSTNGVMFQAVGIASANATSYTVTNLAPSTAYWFRVRAYEGTTYSEYTNLAQVTTQPPPAAPTDLAATPNTKGKIMLTWTDNATYEAGFWIERSTDGVTFAAIALVGANTTAYTNAGLVSGTMYYYRVRAYDGPNYSAYSSVSSATPR